MNNNIFGYYPFGYTAATPVYPAPQVQMPQMLKGRPVSCLDEAKVAQIDLDGSTFIFPDLANKKIYTKKINPDGTAALSVFSLVEGEKEEVGYATREELDALKKTLDGIVAKLGNNEKIKINF